uniref:Calcineurin-like phosphoesterase domain-containing protein n=1 Tax=Amphilophus citrinellus TaxID=61819 RepID=A0A3Q0RLG5_AMPCI
MHCSVFVLDAEHEWTGPFFFIQAADPQLGLMKAWRDGDCDGGGDEWAEEVELTKQALEAVNQLRPKPRFMVLCGDLVHAMPGTGRAQQRNMLHLILSKCCRVTKCGQHVKHRMLNSYKPLLSESEGICADAASPQ